MKQDSPKSLVTGGTGIAGLQVLYGLCKQGEFPRAIFRNQNSVNQVKKLFEAIDNTSGIAYFNQIEWVKADVLDVVSLEAAFQGIDYVYHCAAFVSFRPSDQNLMKKINVEGTGNMVNLANDFNIKKFCHVSSIAALNKNEDNKVIDENAFWKAETSGSYYALTKYISEQEVWRASEEGLNMVIVNPSLIVGPGNWGQSSTNMIVSASKGMKFYAEGVTGYIDSADLAKAMIQLTRSDIVNERFIVSAENLDYKTYFDYLHHALKRPVPKFPAYRPIAEILWRAEAFISFITGKAPLLTKETVESAFSKNYYSSEKLIRALNFKFTPIEESVKNVCKLYQITCS